MARISRNIGIHGSGLSTSTDPRTSAGDHHSGWLRGGQTCRKRSRKGRQMHPRPTIEPRFIFWGSQTRQRGPSATNGSAKSKPSQALRERFLSYLATERNVTNVMHKVWGARGASNLFQRITSTIQPFIKKAQEYIITLAKKMPPKHNLSITHTHPQRTIRGEARRSASTPQRAWVELRPYLSIALNYLQLRPCSWAGSRAPRAPPPPPTPMPTTPPRRRRGTRLLVAS